MNILTTTSTMTTAHVQAFLDFIAPSAGQVIELPNNRVLLNFTEDGEKRVAWLPESVSPAPWNVQTMRLVHLDADELATVRELCSNPSKAKVLGYVIC